MHFTLAEKNRGGLAFPSEENSGEEDEAVEEEDGEVAEPILGGEDGEE